MTTLRYLALLLCLSAASAALAEDELSDAAVALPNPANLATDWWRFVASQPRGERGGAVEQLLAAVRDSTTSTARDEVKALAHEIAALARIYVPLQTLATPQPADPPVVAETYDFDAVLDLHSRKKEIAIELKLGREQVQRKARTIPQLEKRLSTRKADYLVLPSNSPERLPLALEIIAGRLRLAVEAERLRLEKAQSLVWETAGKYIGDELTVAVARLEIDQKTIDRALQGAEKFSRKAEKSSRALRELETAEYVSDTGNAALQSARLIAGRGEVLENETIAARYELQHAYLAARLNRSEADIEKLHEQRTAANKIAGEIKESIQTWREAAAQERARALKLLSNEHDDGGSANDLIAEQRVKVANEISRSTAQIEASVARIAFIEQQASAFLAGETGRFMDWWIRGVDFMQNSWVDVRYWASSSLFEINETPVTLVGMLRIVFILIIAAWVSKLVRHGLEHLGQRNPSVNRSSLYMLGRMFHYVILATAFLVALSSIGLDFTKLAFVAGALGVGIGFGLQAIFSNFISGIIVLFERSLKVGDFVELESGVTGEVREINIRSTLITTNDNIDILVPNSEFVNGRVTNWTLRDAHRRTHIPFGVAYGSDKDLVKKAALEAAAEVPFTLKNYPGRDPQVWLVEFGDSSLNFELVVWLTREAVIRPGSVHSAYSWAIESALAKYDLEIPFPQRDVNVRSFFGRKDESGLAWFDDATEHKST